MAAASKSSQTAKNVVIALLALWSIVSLVVIVVWATSPDLKSSAQCRAELHDTTVKLEGAKVVWSKDKVALEEQVEAGREEQERLRGHILQLVGHLNTTNATLDECRQENVVLNGNISALQLDVDQLRQMEANLTAQLSMQEDQIEALQQNLNQTVLETETCRNLKAAADSQLMAAQSQTRACESSQLYLQKQLQKFKAVDKAPPLKQDPPPSATDAPSSAPSFSGFPAPALLVFAALYLITCRL